MAEQLPDQEPGGKFARGRDQALWMMGDSWARESSGRYGSPTGFFMFFTYREADIAALVEEFADDFAEIGFAAPHELIGHFVLKDMGPDERVEVTEYDTDEEALQSWAALQAQFADWLRREH